FMAAYSPNSLINTVDGRNHFKTWQGKVDASVALPWGLRVSPSYRHQSGQPFGRTFVATLNTGATTFRAEPADARRADNVNVFDMRTEKRLAIGAKSHVSAFVDVYNILNSNAAYAITVNSGTSFNRPVEVIPPRIARLGMKVDW